MVKKNQNVSLTKNAKGSNLKKTSYLLDNGNLMAGFYMKCNDGLEWVNGCFTKMQIFWDPENIGWAVFAIMITS